MTDHEFRDWDAAYVLGALSPDDRRTYELHLATCAGCTAAVAELAGIPGLLGKLTADDAVALTAAPDYAEGPAADHDPGLVPRLAASINRRRRRNRAIAAGLGLAAAIGIAFGGVAVGSSLAAPDTNPTTTLAMSGDIEATLELTEKGWGTRFDWSCDYGGGDWGGTASMSYEMVIRDAAGNETVVATWAAIGDGAGNLAAASSVATDDIRSVEIREADSDTTVAVADL
jgi:hypothetical protein